MPKAFQLVLWNGGSPSLYAVLAPSDRSPSQTLSTSLGTPLLFHPGVLELAGTVLERRKGKNDSLQYVL